MNIKTLSLILFSVLAISACSSDTSDEVDVYGTKTTSKESVEPNPEYSVKKKNVLSRAINDGTTGYDEIIKVTDNKKYAIGNEMARQMNIGPGIYIGRVILVKKELHTKPGYEIRCPKTRTSIDSLKYKTGVISPDLVMSSKRIFGWTTINGVADKDGCFVGMTYLLEIISNAGGQQVGYYYPYSPKVLQWKFIAREPIDPDF